MNAIKPYWKGILAILATLLSAVGAALAGDEVISSNEWVNIAIAGVTAAGVLAAPNVPGAKYTKTVLAVLGAGLAVMASAIIGGITYTEWIQIAIAGFGAVGVYAKRNTGKTTVVR